MPRTQRLALQSALMLFVIACGFVGCGEKKGGLMLAIDTDMKAPKDVSIVSLTISTNNQIKHNFIGRVTPDGKVKMPATLAIAAPDDPNASIRIRAVAFQEQKPRVLRDVRTSIPRGGRVALMRVRLNFIDDGSANGQIPADVYKSLGASSVAPPTADGGAPADATVGAAESSGGGAFDPFTAVASICADPDKTQINGECRDSYVDPNALPDYTDEAVFGGAREGASTTCFNMASCFGGAEPVAVAGGGETAGRFTLDRTNCSVSFGAADPARLNFALVTSSTGECVTPGSCYVPIERGEGGWRLEGTQAKFPSFLCKLLDGKARLFAQAGGCSSKTESQPICRPDELAVCKSRYVRGCFACALEHCKAEAATCFGDGWAQGRWGGVCAKEIECYCSLTDDKFQDLERDPCGSDNAACEECMDGKRTTSDGPRIESPFSDCMNKHCSDTCGNNENRGADYQITFPQGIDLSACNWNADIRSWTFHVDGTFGAFSSNWGNGGPESDRVNVMGNISESTFEAKLSCLNDPAKQCFLGATSTNGGQDYFGSQPEKGYYCNFNKSGGPIEVHRGSGASPSPSPAPGGTCTSASQCPGAFALCCDGACKSGESDPLHCGACNKPCDGECVAGACQPAR